MLTLPEYLGSSRVYSEVQYKLCNVSQFIVCPFVHFLLAFFVCHSSIYGLWYLYFFEYIMYNVQEFYIITMFPRCRGPGGSMS